MGFAGALEFHFTLCQVEKPQWVLRGANQTLDLQLAPIRIRTLDLQSAARVGRALAVSV